MKRAYKARPLYFTEAKAMATLAAPLLLHLLLILLIEQHLDPLLDLRRLYYRREETGRTQSPPGEPLYD